ncbi:N-acetylneuraminate epimerase [Vibrio barjaei]|uniref:N-acetylneuraminate epimerase n=1 Tax=Vibrio barjaei TaxID=1676683 RepID=UPI0022834952|nr:N-acetylneuraminate epimerase [Vibrio barjaei]MCG9788097.1 N-acetylneuraminate epimerase [Vibrio mediterranei]MCY9872400.1 N-acetylneuraminate epimerase [Vibrio barjaei]
MKTRNSLFALALSSLIITGNTLASESWPDLPEGIKSGVSAQIGDKVYAGLGSSGSAFYLLDLANIDKGWQKQADFIGPARNGATATAVNDKIYIFGGAGKEQADATSPILFDTVYQFDTTNDTWSQVKSTSPVGLLGAASYSPNGSQIVFFGGYNKAYFDQYLYDINTTDKKAQPDKWQSIVDNYMGMAPRDYKWNDKVVSYDPKTNQWNTLIVSPYLPNCGSALVSDGNTATLVSGEIKPGLRTAEVKQFNFGAAQPWKSLNSLPAPQSSNVQEGVAGAFGGESNGVVLVAGGANFHGAKQAFEQGKLFAHNGFSKAFNPEIYVLKDNLWLQANNLPEGSAYGASFTTPKGVLIAGGEMADRSASKKVYLLSWNGKSVDIQD